MDQSSLDHLHSPGYQQRQTRISSLHQTFLSYGGDIMARVTRSSKQKATPSPTQTPTKPVKTNADTPIKSVEKSPQHKNRVTKGPYQRQPRKKRSRDVSYKIKKRQQKARGKREALASLSLTKAQRETLRAELQGNNTAKKLADVVLEQQAEIDRLGKQLNRDIQTPEEPANPSIDSPQAGSRHRQPKTAA